MAGRVLTKFQRASRPLPLNAGQDIETMTNREREVLELATQDVTEKETADRHTISLPTVKRHMQNLQANLQVITRHEVSGLALTKG